MSSPMELSGVSAGHAGPSSSAFRSSGDQQGQVSAADIANLHPSVQSTTVSRPQTIPRPPPHGPWPTYKLNNNGQHAAAYAGQGERCPPGCYSLVSRQHPFPEIPGLVDQPDPAFPWDEQKSYLHWTDVRGFHSTSSVLIPSRLPLDDPLFSCLRLSKTGSFIATDLKGRFRLRTSIRNKWFLLENILRAVMRRLVSISNLNDRAFHWWSQPSPLYRGTWDTATEAETGLYAARVSFLPLMACVTYAFLAVRQKYEDTPWLADFYDQTKWPHPKDWLDRVARSSVFNLSVPRIGGIIKWSKASYLTHMIPQLAKANAPIVIYWGSSDESQIIFREIKYSSSKALSPELRTLLPLQCLPPASLHDKLLGIARNPGPSDQTLLPHVRWTRRLLCWEPIFPAYMTEDEREVVNKTSAYHPTSPPHHVQGPVLEHHEASSPLPAVDPAPIPVVHISPWDFIKEREERYQQLRQSASSVECQRWASRHHSAREESIGDRMIHGHKYFKWDLEEDFWRRISLTTQDARDDFEDYAKTQRFFDPVTSTWELCFQLDTDAIPLSFEEEDDDDYQSFPTIPSQPLHPEQPQPQPHAIDEAALSADLDEALQIDQTRQARENRQGSDLSLPVIESPVLAVAIFNGLVLKEEASANAAPGPWPANEESLRKKICRIVGTLFTRDGTQWPLLPHERSSLKVFVDALLNGKLPLQCDLAPSSSQRLQSPKLRGFNLARLSTASYLLTQDISSSSCLPVAGCSYDGIVVHDPSAVVWLTRHMQHHPTSDRYTIQSLAELLLRHGCSFNLAVSRPNTFRGAHQAATNHGVFACRPHGYVGDRDDYLAYCEARDVLLASKGRAALLHGGLAWRLSMDFHGDFHSAIEAVLSPPADLDRWLGEYNGRHWWDEGLSPLAQNLLCGVYEVGDNGASHPSNSHSSWWPKLQGPWRTSGINLHRWTCDAESWYSGVRSCLENDERRICKPMSGKGSWNISFSNHAGKVVAEYEVLCASWLSSCL